MRGLLAHRLACQALAGLAPVESAAGRALAPGFQGRWASSAGGPSTSAQASGGSPPLPTLTDEERRQLRELLPGLLQAGRQAERLGTLTHLAVTYRDLSVVLSALHMRQKGLDPILDDHPAAAASPANDPELNESLARLKSSLGDSATAAADASAAAAAATTTSSDPDVGFVLPMRDVTELADTVQVDGCTPAPEEPVLQTAHMDKISCWSALQPNHIETSAALMTGVKLFPPTEAAYPTFVDFDAALRRLSLHVSGKRLRLAQRLMRKQDKYQLKTWQHSPGEA